MSQKQAFRSFLLGLTWFLLVPGGKLACFAQVTTADFSFRLVDELGKPVEGAHAGITAWYGRGSTEPADESGWHYNDQLRSDREGRVVFHVDRNSFRHTALVTRHSRRGLAAIADIQPGLEGKVHTVTMRSECLVSGRLTCPDLASKDRGLVGGHVYLQFQGKNALSFSAEDRKFWFFVPPGTYTVEAYGSNAHTVEKTVAIEPRQHTLELDPIALPATRLALLEGESAPEISGVIAWKNSKPLCLRDFRGKCVLLDFWGYWCGPCLYRMPELFQLHDMYAKKGLVIIGLHVDLGDGVDTAKLDEKLAAARHDLWQDRDLPFPVALIAEERASFAQGIKGTARSNLAKVYGITMYPTQILIDREGRVVGKFFKSEDQVKRLESLLGN